MVRSTGSGGLRRASAWLRFALASLLLACATADVAAEPSTGAGWGHSRGLLQTNIVISATEQADISAYLNFYRNLHGAPNATWDATIAASSQAWANHEVQVDSQVFSGGSYGESLYALTTTAAVNVVSNVKSAIDSWYAKNSVYNFTTGTGTGSYLLFTCLVWKSSSSFAFGVAKNTTSNKIYVVFNSSPGCNYNGQFLTNVFPANSAVSGGGGGGGGGTTTTAEPYTGSITAAQQAEIIAYVNVYRARHQAPPAVWDNATATFAQSWAEHLATVRFEHSGTTTYGENLFMKSGASISVLSDLKAAVDAWYNEVASYDYASPGFKSGTGHFTCLVWKASAGFGFGIAANATTGATYAVLNNIPPCNFGDSSQYALNVLPPGTAGGGGGGAQPTPSPSPLPATVLPVDPAAGPDPNSCFAAPSFAFTSYYTIQCPPRVEISRVVPTNVTGVPVQVCGARLPDLRRLIQGDWLSGVTLTQSPGPGTFLPPPLPTAPEGEWASHPNELVQANASPVIVSMSVSNPTGAGPQGSCSFPVYVNDAGPPLCPASCPPRLLLVPKPPGVCSVQLPDLRKNLTLAPPDCLRPYAVRPDKYDLTIEASDPAYPGRPASPSPMDGSAAGRWVVDAAVRHVNYTQPGAASCPVRFALYYPSPPAFNPAPRPDASTLEDAIPSSQANASTPHTVPFTFSPGSTEPCGAADDQAWLLRFCRRTVRVETPDGRPADVNGGGNFTFRSDVRAWSMAPGSFTSGLAVSRIVPDAALACPANAPPTGAPFRVLRTYRLVVSCAFNREVPRPPEGSGLDRAPYKSLSLSHPSWIVQIKAPPCL